MVDITDIYVTLITIIGLSCGLSVNQITVTKFVAKKSWFIILLFCIWLLKLKRNVFFSLYICDDYSNIQVFAI